MTKAADPYATEAPASRLRFLYALNPLAKLAAPIPAMIALIFVRDAATPAAFLVFAYLVLLTGARVTRRLLAVLLLAVPLGVVVVGLGFALWTDPALVDGSAVVWRIGEWRLYSGALETGVRTGLRLGAILTLSLIPGATISGPDLVGACVQQLRVPYRIGYAALAALRFVPRFGHELEVIRQAHRVRGANGGRGPLAAMGRWWGYTVPLLAGAIRHAERVALAMDARAFGAYPDRTERHLVPFRTRDAVFALMFWAVSAALLWALFPWGL